MFYKNYSEKQTVKDFTFSMALIFFLNFCWKHYDGYNKTQKCSTLLQKKRVVTR